MNNLLDIHFLQITSLEDQLAVACAKKKMLSTQRAMYHLQASTLDEKIASLDKAIKTLDGQMIVMEGTVSEASIILPSHTWPSMEQIALGLRLMQEMVAKNVTLDMIGEHEA